MPYILTPNGWPVIQSDVFAETEDGLIVEAPPPGSVKITDEQAAAYFTALSEGRPINIVQGTIQVGDIPPPPPPPVPQEITFSQLIIALVENQMVSEEEGEAWLQGNALPAQIETLLNTLPVSERFKAKARLYRMSVCERNHWFVLALAAAQTPNMTEAEVDNFFRFAATL